MPFKSSKQRAKMYAMAERGEMPMSTVEKWQSETGKSKLPLYAPKKGKRGKHEAKESAAYERNEKK